MRATRVAGNTTAVVAPRGVTSGSTVDHADELHTVNTSAYSYDVADNPTGLASGATQTLHPAGTLCWTNPTTSVVP